MKYSTFLVVLLTCFSLNSVSAQTQPPLYEDFVENEQGNFIIEEGFLLSNLEPTLLSKDSISNFDEFPIVFEGIIYQPAEYLEYFLSGFEVELYLIQEEDMLYAYSTIEEAVSHVMNSSVTEGATSQSHLRKKATGCKKPYRAYTFWTSWNPHYAYSFDEVPKNYQGYLVDISYCAKWGWKRKGRVFIPYCKKKGKKDIKVNAKDHVPGKENDILFQKRDIFRYCYGSGTRCLKHVRVCK
jgi:hypothetical protein